MKIKIFIAIISILITFLLIVQSGCSSRTETPIKGEDSTKIYYPKQPDGINANITLCRKVGKITGKRIGTGLEFTIKKKARIYAFFDLKNRENFSDKDLMFHVEWIKPGGKTIYRKRIDLASDDTSSTLKSSISISPGKREPGNYLLRLFLFRELIAEKTFHLKDYKPAISKVFYITANITLCKRIGKKTGKRIGVGTVFKIKKKAKVRAIVDLINRDEYLSDELKFKVVWIGTNGKSFYTKKIILFPEDSSTTITSSISIAPGKRKPGNYKFQLYLFKKLVAEKKFEIR